MGQTNAMSQVDGNGGKESAFRRTRAFFWSTLVRRRVPSSLLFFFFESTAGRFTVPCSRDLQCIKYMVRPSPSHRGKGASLPLSLPGRSRPGLPGKTRIRVW